MNRSKNAPFSDERRGALRALAGAAGCLASLQAASLLGCAAGAESDPATRDTKIPLSQVPEGVRVRVTHRNQPVEILRTAGGITARSLVCSHFGCTVAWKERENVYLCPCHGGRYTASGRVISGPPNAPLTEFEVSIADDALILGGPRRS